jgi:hypothetical protein
MNTITKTFSIKNWMTYTPCKSVGDTSNMESTLIPTIVNNRSVLITTWLNDITGDGFETQVHTLNSGED